MMGGLRAADTPRAPSICTESTKPTKSSLEEK